MNKKELQERIAKKEQQIEKINKRIAKWQESRSLAGYLKYRADYLDDKVVTFDKIVKARKEWLMTEGILESIAEEEAKRWADNDFENYIRNCEIELRYANRNLEEAQVQLDKYNNQLSIICEKESTPKVQILVDFLNAWKENVKEYIRENAEVLKEYYKVNSERCDLHNYKYKYLETMTIDEYKNKENELREKENELKSQINSLTAEVCHRGTIDEEKLDKILEEEKEKKYWNMIEKVTKITGEIDDANRLHIGDDGNLNGIIKGNKGSAKLETIGAGGYNQDIILDSGRHGQCYHFRLLVHKVA